MENGKVVAYRADLYKELAIVRLSREPTVSLRFSFTVALFGRRISDMISGTKAMAKRVRPFCENIKITKYLATYNFTTTM